MRLVLTIYAAALVYAVLTAGVVGQLVGAYDAALLGSVANALGRAVR